MSLKKISFDNNRRRLRLFILRFFYIYFTIYIVFDFLRRVEILSQKPIRIIYEFFLWINKSLSFFDKMPHDISASRDTSYDYFLILWIFTMSFLGVMIWTFFDKNKLDHPKLYYSVDVLLRMYLGFIMFNYGIIKIVHLQFPEPSLYRLITTYGDSSPMELAWSFLGYSKGYNFIIGIAEILSLLLIFRRTMAIGLIFTLIVTVNVASINFFYDVPLKIVSTHLVIITLFLLSHNFKNLFLFFFTQKEVSLKIAQNPFENNRLFKKEVFTLKILMLLALFIFAGVKLQRRNNILRPQFSKSELYGVFNIVSFKKNGGVVPLDLNPNKIWKYIVFEYKGWAQIIYTDKSVLLYNSSVDTINSTVKLVNTIDSSDKFILNYNKQNNEFHFEAIRNMDTIQAGGIVLRKNDFPLFKHKFNWVIENSNIN